MHRSTNLLFVHFSTDSCRSRAQRIFGSYSWLCSLTRKRYEPCCERFLPMSQHYTCMSSTQRFLFVIYPLMSHVSSLALERIRIAIAGALAFILNREYMYGNTTTSPVLSPLNVSLTHLTLVAVVVYDQWTALSTGNQGDSYSDVPSLSLTDC